MRHPDDADEREVILARYWHRHEAELAAGFLDDAGIPYRLQIDDAGGVDFGTTFSRPPVLWVRAADETDAREVLGLDDEAGAGADDFDASEEDL